MNVKQGTSPPMAPSNAETAGAQATSLKSGPDAAPQPSAERRKVHFPSGDTTCAAWHYPGTNGGCVRCDSRARPVLNVGSIPTVRCDSRARPV
jgi:hypothetical protein